MKGLTDFTGKFIALLLTVFLLALFFAPSVTAQTANKTVLSQIVWIQPPLPQPAFIKMQRRPILNTSITYSTNFNTCFNTCRLKENRAIHNNIKDHITYYTANTGPKALITTIIAATPGYYLRC